MYPAPKKVKHPQFVLAVDTGYVADLLRMGQGFNLLSIDQFMRASIDQRDTLSQRLSIRQRDGMERNENFLQILPYTIILQEHAAGELQKLIHSYTRTKQVGEERLVGKRSLGWGGHMDQKHLMWSGEGEHELSILDFKESVKNNILIELTQEITLTDSKTMKSVPVADYVNSDHLRLGEGFIFDYNEDVGRKHLGLVSILTLPEHILVQSNEAELRYDGTLEQDELEKDMKEYENWSKILIDEFTDEIV